MTSDVTPAILAQLAAQQQQIAAQQIRIARLERRHRLPRRLLPLLLAALLVALVPLGTLAANPFRDLNSGSPHNGNIDLIFNAGITNGCEPGARYCPNNTVTREEMASFLARAAGLGTNPPIANAKTAQSATTAQTATNATNAVNAQTAANATNAQNAVNATNAVNAQTAASAANAQNATQLGGQPASAYQLAGQPIANATNAQNLRGIAPNGLLRVASSTDNTILLPEFTLTTRRTATIVAPSSGFLLAFGHTTAKGGTGCTNCQVAIKLMLGASVTPAVTGTTSNSLPQGLTVSTIFTVAAGTHNVELQTGSSASAIFSESEVSVVFIPFGYDGGTTLKP